MKATLILWLRNVLVQKPGNGTAFIVAQIRNAPHPQRVDKQGLASRLGMGANQGMFSRFLLKPLSGFHRGVPAFDQTIQRCHIQGHR